MRLFNLLILIGVLCLYQAVASERQTLIQKNERLISQVESYNESIQAWEQALQTTKQDNMQESLKQDSAVYADGVWEGTGTGFGGEIHVSLTINGGKIQKVEILSAEKEDTSYLNMAKSLTDQIITAQSIKIDTISGATYSSNGILEAAGNALRKAVSP